MDVFVGAINRDMRQILAKTAGSYSDLPAYVGCSGNFTVERILADMGFEEIHGNDVTLYSCALGGHLAGEDVEVKVRPEVGEEFGWLADFLKPGLSTVAAIICSSAFLQFHGRAERYHQRMYQAYLTRFRTNHEATVARLEEALDGIRLKSFHAGDVVDWVAQTPIDSMVASFPPTYKGGYERLYKKIDETFMWEAPTYQVFDDERFEILKADMMARRCWMLSRDQRLEDMDAHLQGMVKVDQKSKTVYMYGPDGPKAFTKPSPPKMRTLNLPRLEGEMGDDDRLELVEIDLGQLNLLRAEYLNPGILPAGATVCRAVTVGGKLVGALGFSQSTYFGHLGDAYMVADFAIRPSVYKRLAKLVLVAALSKEAQRLCERMVTGRVRTIATTVFTDAPVSMKYRGIFDLLKRDEENNRLVYVGEAGKWDLSGGFEWWNQKHSQKWETQ